MPQVTVLRREPAERLNDAGRLEEGTRVTYFTQAIPPRVVFIPKLDPTDDEVQSAIKQDIDTATDLGSQQLRI